MEDMDKMLQAALDGDEEAFATAFDSEVKNRIADKLPDIAKNYTSNMFTSPEAEEAPEVEEPEAEEETPEE